MNGSIHHSDDTPTAIRIPYGSVSDSWATLKLGTPTVDGVTWTTQRLTPRIGAHLDRFTEHDLEDVCASERLHAALMEHQVLVISGFPIDAEAHTRLASLLGDVANNHHLYSTHPDNADVVVLEWGGDKRPDAAEWHSDMTYLPSPPFASVLQAVELPPCGGDTLWASMYSILDAIPAGLRSELEELSAVHDFGAFRTPAYQNGGVTELNKTLASTGSAVHPIVATHPYTRRPYLNISESFTRFVVGLSAPESARLLGWLFDLINRPDHHVRLRWEPGTVAIWDNRATQHYAVDDYFPQRRVMHRVTVRADQRT